MTVQTPTVLKTYFQTGDIPTEAQFVDLIDSTAQEVIDLAAEVDDKVDGDDARLTDARNPLPHNQAISTITGLQTALDDKADLDDLADLDVTFLTNRFARHFSLADWTDGYPTNIPLLVASDNPDTQWRPHQQTYPVGTYNSAPALYDALTELGGTYGMTGFTMIIPSGYWAIGTKEDAGASYLLPLLPRMSIVGETGNPASNVLIQTNSMADHMWGYDEDAADAGATSEPKDITFLNMGLWGNWETSGTHDIIHLEKPLTGAWGDTRMKIVNCFLSKARRHAVFYSARGDSEIRSTRFDGSGDSMVFIDESTDNKFYDNIVVSAGRHGLHAMNATNLEINRNVFYFGGQNQQNIWDGTVADTVRKEGAVIYIENSGSIRGNNNRLEDTTGHGIVLSSAGIIDLRQTYFNNLGSIGSNADRLADLKDFTAENGNITATVDGVDVVVFERGGNSAKGGDYIYIEGFVRQARVAQQIRYPVNIDPENTTRHAYRDILVDLLPAPNETTNLCRNPDDSDRWAATGNTTRWVAPGNLTSRNEPFILNRSAFKWNNALIPQFHAVVKDNRVSLLNPYEEVIKYNIATVAVTANVTSATFTGNVNNQDHLVSYAVDADLSGTLGKKHAVRFTGMTNASNNGVFNISSITSTNIIVHNYNRNSATDDETGSSGDVFGPSPALILRDTQPGREYKIRVGTKSGSTEDLRIYNSVSGDSKLRTSGTLLETITTASTEVVAVKDPFDGWVVT